VATGLWYRRTFAHLQLKPPPLVPVKRWQKAVEDGSKFLAVWGEQAETLGWASADLFGLHAVPDKPHPSYQQVVEIRGRLVLVVAGQARDGTDRSHGRDHEPHREHHDVPQA
jgi:hypothetical protein